MQKKHLYRITMPDKTVFYRIHSKEEIADDKSFNQWPQQQRMGVKIELVKWYQWPRIKQLFKDIFTFSKTDTFDKRLKQIVGILTIISLLIGISLGIKELCSP